MNDEKKYNEALERARDYYKANLKLDKADENLVLEEIFPELAESEDEKIRKAIRGWIYTRPSQFFDGGFSKEEMLAWLEKQGEQILANSVKTCKDEQKPAWSEEDEEEFQIAIDTLVKAGQYSSADWLKSLKDRYA